MRSSRMAAAGVLALFPIASALARPDFGSREGWRSAAGTFDTVGFDDLAGGTALGDQYLARGVRFDGTDGVISDARFADGAGVFARDNNLTIEFTAPIRAFGADYVGQVYMVFYSGNEMVRGTYLGHLTTDRAFGGSVSGLPFDRVVLSNRYEGALQIDNVHWSFVPSPGGVACLSLLAALCAMPRRCE